MIDLQIDDVVYKGFIGASITKDVESLCGTIDFDASTLQNGSFPISRGSKIIARVNNISVLDGYVDQITVDYNATTHTIKITGRDKTQDLADSKIDSKIELKTPVTLVNVIKSVLTYIGNPDISIVDTVGGLPVFSAEEMVSGQIGQGAFDFLSMFCAKRQVLLTTDGNGDLLITRGAGVDTGATIICEKGGAANNILAASVKYDDSKRFYKYVIRSQANLAALSLSGASFDEADNPNESYTNDAITSTVGSSIDNTVRKSRLFVMNADKTSNITESVDRAQWERDIHNARAINYTATLQGHGYFGAGDSIWKPLQIVRVVDDFCNINAQLIIRKVEYIMDLQGGNRTKIDCVPLDTFKLLSDESKKKEKKKKKGGDGINKNDSTAKLNLEFNTQS